MTKVIHKQMIWSSNFVRRQFEGINLDAPSDFFLINNKSNLQEIHLIKSLGRVGHSYISYFMKIDKSRFRIKIASGKYYESLIYEAEVLKYLPALYLTPPEISAYYADDVKKEAVIVFKYPPGFHLLKDLIELDLKPTILADFEVRKKSVMKKISKALHKMHYSEFYYPYLYAENILVKHKSDEIAIVDLDGFLPLKRCPWYYRLEVVSWFLKKKEWCTLRKSLASNMYTKKYMKSLLN
jgi:hypothetical protein